MGPHTAIDRGPHSTAADEIAVRLRAAGLSPTPRRRRVLEALVRRRRPAGARELHVELTDQGHRVGISTVYRTLGALAGAGAGLLHIFVTDGETRYRACARDGHCHLVCQRCGTVTEHPTDIGGWLERIRTETDFEPDPGQADVHGVCGACRRADTYDSDLAG